MADQEDEFNKLPLADLFQHKVWKARKIGYERASKEFASTLGDEGAPCFRLFRQDTSLLKTAAADSNVAAQQEGLACICALLQHGPRDIAVKARAVAMPAIVEKGIASTRAGVKTNAVEALMLFVEIDKPDIVVEEILGLLGNKQPKVVAAAVSTLTALYHAFGVKIIDPKPVLKQLPKPFAHADKNVRAEASNLAVELYRWLKEAMKPAFWQEIKPMQQQDLEKAFAVVAAEPPPRQERLTRAQQAAAAAAEATPDDYEEEGVMPEDEAEEVGAEMDSYDLAEPVEILKKTPPEFYERLGSAKWKDRKEALEEFYKVANTPRIKEDHYEELLSALAKCMKDANIMVVTVAASIVEVMSKGLRRGFARYRSRIMSPMLERLKEKKQSVADALGAALDGVFSATGLGECLEDIVEFLKHKNPQVKLGTAQFLVRCLRNTRDMPTPPQAKVVVDSGTKLLTESTEVARNAGAEALGTLMKIIGEDAMRPFLDPLDDIRKTKIKEFYEQAEVKAKKPKPKPKPKAKAPPARAPAGRPVAKKPAPAAARKAAAPPQSPPAASTPAAPRSAARPGPASKLAGPGGAAPRSGLAAPGGLKLGGKRLAAPSATGITSPTRKPQAPAAPIMSPQEEDAPHPSGPPRLGLVSRGLAGRSLAKPNSAPAEPPAPAPAPSGLSAEDRLELVELRAERDHLNGVIDELRQEKSKHEVEINELRTQEAELIEERTRNRLTIKAKETQLVRARSDAEVAQEEVARQKREIDRLKRELARSVRAASPPPADVSEQIYRDQAAAASGGGGGGGGGSKRHSSGITVESIDRYESNRASREVGYQRARQYMNSPSEEKENGGLEAPRYGKPPSASGAIGSRSPARFSRDRPVSGSSRGGDSESGARGEHATNEQGEPIENWRRAAEVTSQLKARIEQMKARQGLSRPH